MIDQLQFWYYKQTQIPSYVISIRRIPVNIKTMWRYHHDTISFVCEIKDTTYLLVVNYLSASWLS